MTEPIADDNGVVTYTSTPDEVASTPVTSTPDEVATAVDTSDDELDPRARAAMTKLRHEAAANRVRAQEAEAKVSALEGAAARLAALEHAEVERIAAEKLIDRSDVWRVDADAQQSWYDEKFSQLQPDKVRESIEALVAAKPHLARAATPPPTQRPIEGLRPGASPEPSEAKVTWASVLRR